MAGSLPFFVCDSFSADPFAGNPAGVFLYADDLTPNQMRRMAGEVSLESAFVSGHTGRGWRLRYFTGTSEVDLCGHATVAAATVLADYGLWSTGESVPFWCNAGMLSVHLKTSEGRVLAGLRQAGPSFGPVVEAEDLLDLTHALGATPHDLHPLLPPQVVSSGSPFLFVAVRDPGTVDAAPGSMEAVIDMSHRMDCYGLYVFTLDSRARNDEPAIYARCFAPAVGLPEDPVTGSASGALGYYLARHKALPGNKGTFTTLQGASIGRAGYVRVTVDRDEDGAPTGVETAGVATIVCRGTMDVPPTS